MSETKGRGWVRVMPCIPLYACDGWRIQKQSNGWRWWYVIQVPLVACSPHGVAKTLRAAMDAVDAARALSGAPAATEGT